MDSRAPFWVVEIDQPRCSLNYAVSPCLAPAAPDGQRCYRTFHTCRDRANIALTETRTWRFASAEIPLPPLVQRAYAQVWRNLKSVSATHQEVDPESSLTRTDKMTLVFYDRGGVDGFPAFDLDRTSTTINTSREGTFFKRLMAIWPNFRNAEVRVKRGFYTGTFRYQDLHTLWRGKAETLRFNVDGTVTLSCVDMFRPVEKQLPPKISGSNVVEVTFSRTASEASVTDASKFTDPATVSGGVYVAMTNADTARREIMKVTGRDTVTNKLQIERAKFGTIADPHYVDEEIREIVVQAAADGVGGLHPIVVALDLLNRVGISSSDIDTGSFYREGAWTAGMRVRRFIEEPVEVRKLCFELGELMAMGNFVVDEALKIRLVMLNAPAKPGETIRTVRDSPNVLIGSGEANMNEKEGRLTHCAVFFDKNSSAQASVASGDVGSTSSADYQSIAVAVNIETYDADYYGSDEESRREKRIKDAGAWLIPGDFPAATIAALRWVQSNAHAPILFLYHAELRDDPMIIGDAVDVTTFDIQDANGAQRTIGCRVMKKARLEDHSFHCTLRSIGNDVLDNVTGGTMRLRYLVTGPPRLGNYSAGIQLPLWAWNTGTTEDDKEYGFIASASNLLGGSDPAYYLW